MTLDLTNPATRAPCADPAQRLDFGKGVAADAVGSGLPSRHTASDAEHLNLLNFRFCGAFRITPSKRCSAVP
jgi:hypothetical protein